MATPQVIDAAKIIQDSPDLKFPTPTNGMDVNAFVQSVAPLTPESVTRQGNDFFVNEGGAQRAIDLPEFKQLGINADFVQPGSTVSFNEARGLAAPSQAQQDVITQRNSQSGLFRGLVDRTQQLFGKGERQRQIEEQLGLTQNSKALQETNLQIAQLKGEYDKQIEALTGQGRGITTDILNRQENKLIRQRAVEIGALSAVAQALQGNITLAQNTAKQTVNIEFEPIENEIDLLEKFLEANKSNLTAAEKRLADERQAQLDLQKEAISIQKEERKGILDIAIKAAQSGADPSTINTILSAQSQEQALSYAGGSLQTGGLNQSDLFNAELKLSDNFQKYASEANTAIRQSQVARVAFEDALKNLSSGQPIGAQSQALITAFNKLIDPTSVVRESEYARTPEGASLLNRIDGKAQQFKNGGVGLNEAELTNIYNAVDSLLKGYQEQQLGYAQLVANQANSIGANLQNILPPDVLSVYQNSIGDQQGFQGVPFTVPGTIPATVAAPTDAAEAAYQASQVVGGNGQSVGGFVENILNGLSSFFGATKASAATNDQFSVPSAGKVQNVTPQVVDRIANAIAQIESGGNYQAVGPATSKGNRAYGKYQVMDFNIPNWTREVLGRSLTPKEFLSNPEAQDKVARAKMTQILNQYKDVNDVASVWFSGRPVSVAGNSSDVTGTSVPQYIRNFQRALYNL